MSNKQKKKANVPKPRDIPAPVPLKKERALAEMAARGIAESHIDAAMSMMDPGEFVSGQTKIPARGAWLRSVTTESIVHKLSTADGSIGASGAFSLEARARPDGTLILRGGAALAESGTLVNGVIIEPSAQTFGGLNTQVDFKQAILQQDTASAGAILGTVAAGGTAWVVPLTCTAGGVRAFQVANPTISAAFHCTPYTGPIGALVAGTTYTKGCAIGSSAEVSVTFPAATTHVGFRYSFVPNGHEGAKLQAQVGLSGSTVLMAVTNEAQTINLTTLAGVSKLRAYRVVGQSLLLTYTGSQINNGGDIAIARVSSAWSADPGVSVYDSLLKLPKSRRYTGRVAKGAHCFWAPETVEDFEPKLYGADYDAIQKPSYKMVAAGTLDDNTESILLQLETIVEFQTDEPSYASVAYAPPWDSFDIALHVLARMNPCGENPSHLTRIRKFLSPKIKQAMTYAIENPAAIGAAIAKILPLLL